MIVLALDKGLRLRGVVAVVLAPLMSGVHRTHDVGIGTIVGTLPMDGTAGVVVLYPLVGLGEVRSVNGLVTERPDNHTRMDTSAAHNS